LSGKIFKVCFAAFIVGDVLAQFNPGLELNITNADGWSIHSTSGTGIQPSNVTSSSRSGARAINVLVDGTSSTRKYQHDGYTVTVPASGGPYHVHVIGHLNSYQYDDYDRVALGIKNLSTGITQENALLNEANYTRRTRTWTNAAAGIYAPLFIGSGSGNSPYTSSSSGDDFIIYYSTQSAVDLIDPNPPTNLCVNSSGGNNVITWSDGADAELNLNGVMILRAPVGTALPTVNDQAYYSTNMQIGPNYLNNGWTVLTNTLAPGTQTFTDAGAAGTPYIYAVYMRDIAYNYSAPISFTTANAGPDQYLCGAPGSATMAATAAPGGYTGTWSNVSGGGSITTPGSAATTITAIPAGINTYRWTVTNGAGCSTFNDVIVSVNTTVPSLPTLGSPVNGSSIAASPVNLVWGNGGGADSYVVSLGTSSPPGTSFPSQTSNSYFAGSLNPSTTYYWRVTATNSCGTTVGSIWSFNTLPVYSNTSSTACNAWDSGNTYTGFTRTIDLTAAGLPTPLGTGSGQYVLNEVEVHLGSSGCKRDLSTYDFRLTAPNGAFIDFFPTNKLTTNTSVQWVRVKFRDHAALEMINEYPNAHQEDIHPYSIGYYAIQTVDGFLSTFNGVNPNGIWTFAIKENSTDEISFNSVTLKFGPKILVNNIQNQVYYDNCVTSQCFDGRQVTVASNMYLQNGDPILTATNPNGSCWYNGANNNSGWFDFKASSTTAYITVSGMSSSSTAANQMQLVVVQRPAAGCVNQNSSWVIPTGGCSLASSTPANNTAYLSGSGGGGFTYSTGITGNVEFNLSGLTVGQTYYLYIDGNGGATSPFYIEGLTGIATCDNLFVPLPIEWYSFNANIYNKTTHIMWQTATERDNDFFTVERSANGIDWEVLELIDGAGVSNELLHYETYDNYPLKGISYYRLKQTDFDGKSTYSDIKSISNTEELMVLPNPGNGIFYVSGLSDRKENQVIVMDVTGKIIANYITEDAMLQMNLEDHPAGIYYVKVNEEFTIKVVKWAND